MEDDPQQQHQPADCDISRHFPNTVRLMQQRRESESPQRQGADGSDNDDDLVLLISADAGSPCRRNSGDKARLEQQLSHKMRLAAQRRDRIHEQRQRHLQEAERLRNRKVQQTRQLRERAIGKFIEASPAIFLQFDQNGLHLRSGEKLRADIVEHRLISDPCDCKYCNGKPSIHERMCPVTKLPHRRSLVVAAEKLLKLIGDTHVNLIPPKQVDSDTQVTPKKTKTRRGISVNPQLFVLAYYNAASHDENDDQDALFRESALHLLEVVETMKAALGATDGPVNETYVNVLLKAFAAAWRQYVKCSEAVVEGATDTAKRSAAKEELIANTQAAYLNTMHRIGDLEKSSEESPELTTLKLYAETLKTRMEQLGGGKMDKVAAAQPAAEPAEEVVSPPVSPRNEPQSPLVMAAPSVNDTHGFSEGTSGSETEGEPQRMYGPALPPRWTVDEKGNSVPPPPPSEEEKAEEKRKRLEFKALNAYKARIQPRKYADPREEAQNAYKEALTAQQWTTFREELQQKPPNLERIPTLFDAVTDRLIEGLPRRLRSRVAQEMRDVLDWSIVRRKVRQGQGESTCLELMKYVVNKVIELGAPDRADTLKERCAELDKEVSSGAPTAKVVVEMFQFMFESINQLREDISRFNMIMISEELAKNAVEYQQEFIDECLPPAKEWTSTQQLLQEGLQEFRENASSSTALPILTNSFKTSLFYGGVSLLKSSNAATETRWSRFAKEGFYFDRGTIFNCANTVQQCTLRLMLGGTVSLVLQPQRLQPAAVHQFLAHFDQKLVNEWLSSSSTLTLDALKEEIVAEIHYFLNSEEHEAHAESAPGQRRVFAKALSEAEIAVLKGVVDKMVDTTSMQYATFEKKIVDSIRAHIFLTAAKQETNAIRPLGQVNSDVVNCARDMRIVLEHNWEVYSQYYSTMAFE